jgi:hypothetical protein
MDEILASIRKIISEEPPGSVALGKAPPPAPAMTPPQRATPSPFHAMELPPLGAASAPSSLHDIDDDIADLIDEAPDSTALPAMGLSELRAPEPVREAPKRSGWLFGRGSGAASPSSPPPPSPAAKPSGTESRRPAPMTDAIDIARSLGRRPSDAPAPLKDRAAPVADPFQLVPRPSSYTPAAMPPVKAQAPFAEMPPFPPLGGRESEPRTEPRTEPKIEAKAEADAAEPAPRSLDDLPPLGATATAAAVAVAEQLARGLPGLDQPTPMQAVAPVVADVVRPAPFVPAPAPAAPEPVAVSEPEPVVVEAAPPAPAVVEPEPVRFEGHAAAIAALINGPEATAEAPVVPAVAVTAGAAPEVAMPVPGVAKTLEEAVAEMLKPMLRQWLDQHMPGIVEKVIKAELAGKGTGGDRG